MFWPRFPSYMSSIYVEYLITKQRTRKLLLGVKYHCWSWLSDYKVEQECLWGVYHCRRGELKQRGNVVFCLVKGMTFRTRWRTGLSSAVSEIMPKFPAKLSNFRGDMEDWDDGSLLSDKLKYVCYHGSLQRMPNVDDVTVLIVGTQVDFMLLVLCACSSLRVFNWET